MPKICKKCKQNPVTLNAHGRQTAYCVLCRQIYDKAYFGKNIEKKTASATKLKKDLLKWYRALKNNKLCLACGGGPFHFCQLDYDHVPGRGTKVADVSKMVRLGYSREKVEAEIAKCDLICKNCHSLRTFNRRFGKTLEQGLF